MHGFAENSDQIGSAALIISPVTGGATQLLKKGVTAGSERAGSSAAGEPGFVLRGLHYYDLANHAGVHGAAILRTEQVVHTGLGGTEPCGGVAPGQHVLLDAEGRNVEAVDHVLRGHNQFDVAAHRNVQFVDLSLTFLMLEFPHPLLGYDIDFGCAAGWSALVEVNDCAPDENCQEDSHGDDRPGYSPLRGAFDLLGF